jgi:hypothetical protein
MYIAIIQLQIFFAAYTKIILMKIETEWVIVA